MIRTLISGSLIICAIILEVPGLVMCYCAAFLADLTKNIDNGYSVYCFEKMFQKVSLFLNGPFHNK